MNNLYETLGISSGVAVVILSVAFMLLGGYLMTRITKKLKLPNVTAYIVTGILIGPYVLNLVPPNVVGGTAFLPDIALAFIAFSTGEYFRFGVLKKNGLKVVVITVAEALYAAILVFILTYFILRLDLAFSIVLAALATATAPASTMMTIRQTHAHGDYVDTLLQVVALDDVVGLVIYSIAISVATASISGEAPGVSSILIPIGKNLLVIVIGALFGLILKAMIGKHSTDNRLIISIAVLFTFCGLCALIDISPLLGCMFIGTVYINTTDDERLFAQLNYFSPPLLLLFFVRSGINFDLGALTSKGAIGNVPLLVIGILYFIVRIIGKYIGAFAGSAAVHSSKEIRYYLGLALIPQAGVAIGLAALGARTLGGETGNALETIILSSSVLYELIGPACAKLGLHLSHSFSDKLEDIVTVAETDETGHKKTSVELLIERIAKIQEEIPEHEVDPNEQAFTEAAENYMQYHGPIRRGGRRRFII
ncbi:MAG: cation:proton antiporter [Lachnospiraceae bacterium]|nr:cation:proton antiporter [Lachnospiraceae bacterium]